MEWARSYRSGDALNKRAVSILAGAAAAGKDGDLSSSTFFELPLSTKAPPANRITQLARTPRIIVQNYVGCLLTIRYEAQTSRATAQTLEAEQAGLRHPVIQ